MSRTNANWPYPLLFAHRGGGSLAPENTLAAMKKGYERGYFAFEFDVKLTADDIAILMHDSTLERTTNGQGFVAEKTIAELEQLDAGSWHGAAFRGEPVARFSTVAKYLHGLGLMANVEIKPCAGREMVTGKRVAELCRELWADRLVQPLISSFSIETLRAARAAASALPMGLLVEQPVKEHLPLLQELQCVSIHAHHQHITPDGVRFFHDLGYRVLTYTVNDPARVRELLEMGVDGLFTDRLDEMARQFPDGLRGPIGFKN